MYTVSQATEKIVRVKPFVMEALAEGLLNISSLARQIQPAVEKLTGKEVKQGAIVMALNRMMPHLEQIYPSSLDSLLDSLGDLVVRSNLTDFTFRNSNTILDCHIRVMKEMSTHHDGFYTLVRGVYESNLVVGSTLQELVEIHFANEICTYRQLNLSAITLKLPADNVAAAGFYYQILKAIAWEGINLREVISSTNEFTVMVNDEDVDRAFTTLKNLKTAVRII